jgi:hypothetical protein
MEQSSRGKFCSSCKREVIDFSGFTDQELHEFFSKRTEIPCGRFHSSQLNRQILREVPRVVAWPNLSKRIAAVLAFLTLKFSESTAQINTPATTQATAKQLLPTAQNQKILIDGFVKDEAGYGIVEAEIRLGDQIIARSDSSGRFQLEIEPALLSKTSFLQFISPGRVTAIRTYHPAMQSTSYDITLTKPNEYRGLTLEMPVLQTVFESFKLKKPVESLSNETRKKLAITAIAMRNNPSAKMMLVSYGTTPKEIQNANASLNAVKTYFILREGISEDRIHTRVRPKQYGKVNIIDILPKSPSEESE